MKTCLSLLFFFSFIISSQAQNVPSSEQILKTATAKAAKEKKNVIVIFHASWCIWCRKMDASLNDAAIKKYFDKNYVITHLVVQESKDKKNLENAGGEAYMEQVGGREQGLPYWVVLDAKGNKLADSKTETGDNTGCPASEKEVAHFISVLKNTSSLKAAELEEIATRFRKNEN